MIGQPPTSITCPPISASTLEAMSFKHIATAPTSILLRYRGVQIK
jgi:hypothetical protein